MQQTWGEFDKTKPHTRDTCKHRPMVHQARYRNSGGTVLKEVPTKQPAQHF
jgi:hypothetical protein